MLQSATIFSAFTIVLALAAAIYGLTILPEGDQFAVHWDLQGNPNRFETRKGVAISFLLLPGIMLAIHGLLWGVQFIKSERAKIEAAEWLYAGIWMLTQATMLIVAIFVIDTIVAGHVNLGGLDRLLRVVVVLSILPLIILGNRMGKRHNGKLLPMNLPWELKAEHSRARFLRFTGRLLIAVALISFAVVLWNPFAGLAALSVLALLLPFPLLAYGRKLAKDEGGRAA